MLFPWRKIGDPIWTNGSGTISVNPCVLICMLFINLKWLTHDSKSSICPNIIVAVDLIPNEWATSITYPHWEEVILSSHKNFLILSSSISAAVPGRVPSPASLSSVKYVSTDLLTVLAPCHISRGVKPWICISGNSSLIFLTKSI